MSNQQFYSVDQQLQDQSLLKASKLFPQNNDFIYGLGDRNTIEDQQINFDHINQDSYCSIDIFFNDNDQSLNNIQLDGNNMKGSNNNLGIQINNNNNNFFKNDSQFQFKNTDLSNQNNNLIYNKSQLSPNFKSHQQNQEYSFQFIDLNQNQQNFQFQQQDELKQENQPQIFEQNHFSQQNQQPLQMVQHLQNTNNQIVFQDHQILYQQFQYQIQQIQQQQQQNQQEQQNYKVQIDHQQQNQVFTLNDLKQESEPKLEVQKKQKVCISKQIKKKQVQKDLFKTKNIPKVFGNAFRNYVASNNNFVQLVCQKYQISQKEFNNFVKKLNFYSIKGMREAFQENMEDLKQNLLKKAYRILVNKFLREDTWTWFLSNKRISNCRRLCNFRFYILRGIQCPSSFNSWED